MPLSAVAARRTSRLQQGTKSASSAIETGFAPIGDIQRIEKRKRHEVGRRREPDTEPEHAVSPCEEVNTKASHASDDPHPQVIYQYQGLEVRDNESTPHDTPGIKTTKQLQPQRRQTTKSIIIEESQTLLIEGVCELEIIQGAVLVSGAVLKSSKQRHRLIALPPDPTIEIRATRGPSDGQRSRPLVVLFQDPDHDKRKGHSYNYQLVRHVEHRNPEIVQDIDHEPLFRAVTGLCSKKRSVQVAFAGPSNSGKRNLVRKLANALLTRTSRHMVVLELDPGQSDFGLAGELSLYRLSSPLLTPTVNTRSSQLWSIFYGEKLPSDSPARYARCVQRLVDVYRSHSRQHENCLLIANVGGLIHGSAVHTISQAMKDLETDLLMTLIGPESIEHMYGFLDQVPAVTKYTYSLTPEKSAFLDDAHQRAIRRLQALDHFDRFRGLNAEEPWAFERHLLTIQRRDCHIVDVCGEVYDAYEDCVDVVCNGSILALIDLSKPTGFESGHGITGPNKSLTDASIPHDWDTGTRKAVLDQEKKVPAKDHLGGSADWWTEFYDGIVIVKAFDVKSGHMLFLTDIDASVFGPDNVRNLVFVHSKRKENRTSNRLELEPWLPQNHQTQGFCQSGAYVLSEGETALLASRPWRVRRNLK